MLLFTPNEVEYFPAVKVDVANVSVSVPVSAPPVGDTLNQLAVEGTIDHLSVPLPLFLTCTVWAGAFCPTVACTLIDVGLTERVGAADANTGQVSAATTKTNKPSLGGRAIMVAPDSSYLW
jgi:hypothetical protein